MRLRFPELLDAREMTPYALAKASRGRISMSTAYRLVDLRGHLDSFDAEMLEALCEVLDVEPGTLLQRVHGPPPKKVARRRAQKATPKRAKLR
jgi:DNA-binding Xre family transcriptional regulator